MRRASVIQFWAKAGDHEPMNPRTNTAKKDPVWTRPHFGCGAAWVAAEILHGAPEREILVALLYRRAPKRVKTQPGLMSSTRDFGLDG